MDVTANGQVIQALYQAYTAGDVIGFDSYADDSLWVELGRNNELACIAAGTHFSNTSCNSLFSQTGLSPPKSRRFCPAASTSR